MVKICDLCSGIKKESLTNILREDQIEVTCIEVCHKFADKCFGYINSELCYANNEEEFIQMVKEKLKK